MPVYAAAVDAPSCPTSVDSTTARYAAAVVAPHSSLDWATESHAAAVVAPRSSSLDWTTESHWDSAAEMTTRLRSPPTRGAWKLR